MDTTVTMNCSFCDKESTDVDKLVAGPEVYICNECVGLCVEIMSSSQPGPKSSASPEATLEALPALSRAAEGMAADLAHRVESLRESGVEWSRIATGLGTTEDEARRRFDPAP